MDPTKSNFLNDTAQDSNCRQGEMKFPPTFPALKVRYIEVLDFHFDRAA